MINELKRFLQVAQEGNLTRTAEKMFITQSALTQSIHRLEKELHTKLFQQKGKQLHLTEDGKSLVIIGEKILTLWSLAHDSKVRNMHIPTYSIGMFDNVALRLGTFLQKTMRTKSYHLELIIDSTGKVLRQLQLGTLDAALCVLHRSFTTPSHLTLLQTYTEALLPVSSITFSQSLTDIPFILYNRGSHTRMQIDELFMQQSIQPTIYAESTSVTFMRELALLGSGVALLPKNFVQEDLKRGSLKIQKMPLQWKRNYGLLIQKQYTAETPFVNALQKALTTLS